MIYNKEERNFIVNYYGTIPIKEIAQELGRHPSSITHWVERHHPELLMKNRNIENTNENERECKECHVIKPLKDNFSKHTSRKTVYYSRTCKECESAIRRINRLTKKSRDYENKKQNFLNSIKNIDFVCTKCGKTKKGSEYNIRYVKDQFKRRSECAECDINFHKKWREKTIKNNKGW